MSSTTKKTRIDPKSKEYVDSLMTTSDMYRALSDYERSIKEENDIKKRRIAKEIENMGQHYLDEIDRKNQEKENEKNEMIKSIVSLKDESFIKLSDLNEMSYDEVKSIYIKVMDSKKPWYRLFIEFIMGW